MERTSDDSLLDGTTLTEPEMVALSERARGFFGAPEPADLKQAMQALDPGNPEDKGKLEELKLAYKKLSESADGTAVDGILASVRNLLGLKESPQQEAGRWYYAHPGM